MSNLMHSATDRLVRLEPQLARYLAAPALVLLALSTFSGVGGGNTALFLLLVGFLVLAPVYVRELLRDPIFLATVVLLLWVLIIALNPAPENPEDIAWVRNKAGEWARVLMLPALLAGFWLARLPRLVQWLPLLMAAGYTIKVLSLTRPELLAQFVSGEERAGYDNDITRFGIYSAISLFAAISSIWAVRGMQAPSLRRPLYMAVAICAAVAVAGLVFSQTRAAWLATAVVIVLCIALGLRGVRAGTVPRKPMLIAAASTGLVLVCVAILFRELLTNRLLDQAGTIAQLFQGGWDDPPLDPVGYRISAYREGLLTWLQAPWFGHGPGVDWFTFRNRTEPALDFLMHFHNLYINLLATWGVVGFTLFAISFSVLAVRAWRAHAAGFLPTHTGMFLLASAVSLLLFGLFDQILLDERIPFLLAILGGAAAASGSAGDRATRADHETEVSDTKGEAAGTATPGDGLHQSRPSTSI